MAAADGLQTWGQGEQLWGLTCVVGRGMLCAERVSLPLEWCSLSPGRRSREKILGKQLAMRILGCWSREQIFLLLLLSNCGDFFPFSVFLWRRLPMWCNGCGHSDFCCLQCQCVLSLISMVALLPIQRLCQECFPCLQLARLVVLFGIGSIFNQQQLSWEHPGVLENPLYSFPSCPVLAASSLMTFLM